jgi:hypothetical protein
MVAASEVAGFELVPTLLVLQLTTQLVSKPSIDQIISCLNFCNLIIVVIFLRLKGVKNLCRNVEIIGYIDYLVSLGDREEDGEQGSRGAWDMGRINNLLPSAFCLLPSKLLNSLFLKFSI